MTDVNTTGRRTLVAASLLLLAFASCGERDDLTLPLRVACPEYFAADGTPRLPAGFIDALPVDARAAHLAGVLVVNLDEECGVVAEGLSVPQTPLRHERLIRRRDRDPWVDTTFRLSDGFRWRSEFLRSLGLRSCHPAGRPYLEIYWPDVDPVELLETRYARNWVREARRVAAARESARHRAEAIQAALLGTPAPFIRSCKSRIGRLDKAIRKSQLRQFMGLAAAGAPASDDGYLLEAYEGSAVVRHGNALLHRSAIRAIENAGSDIRIAAGARPPSLPLDLARLVGVAFEVKESLVPRLVEAGFVQLQPGTLILAEYRDADRLLAEAVEILPAFERALRKETERVESLGTAWSTLALELSAKSEEWAELVELLDREAKLREELLLQQGLRDLVAEEPLLPEGIPGRVEREIGR